MGGEKPIAVDVRVISATHRNLSERIAEGTFREDLFYRLKVVAIELPSLVERRDDILSLAMHFSNALPAAMNVQRKNCHSRSSSTERRWPGNVRELEHSIEQAVILADGQYIEAEDLGLADVQVRGLKVDLPDNPGEFFDVIEDVTRLAETQLIHRALSESQGNRSQAARLLGISRRALLYKLKKYALDE